MGGGVNCLFPIETHITCDFPGGGGGVRTPCPPSGSALGCDLFSFLVRKMMRSPLAPVLVFLQLRCMFSVEPSNKIVSCTYCMTVAWFIQHLLQFVFAFFNHSIKITQFLFAGGHFFFKSLSKPFWQMMLFVINVNEWRHIRWRNYRTQWTPMLSFFGCHYLKTRF